MHCTYLLVDVLSAIVPFLFSFHPKIRFDQQFRPFVMANIIVAIIFLAWDVVFTTMGVWGFSERYTLGFNIFYLPIEELLFFICIPFACVFTYHCLNKFFTFRWPSRLEKVVVLLLSFFLLVIGFLHLHQAYTSVTFISLALVLPALKFILRVPWLPSFLSIYPFLLIPFFIVNGILTGSGLQQPVVWYNNADNLGIRLFTIPVEDVFYGMELLVLNVGLYEWLKAQHIKRLG